MKVVVAALMAGAMLLSCGLAEAQTLTPAASALLNSSQTNINRPVLAKQILTYCNEVLGLLPRNTPREDSWVDDEFKSGNMERIGRVIQSVEAARAQLVSSFNDCKSHSTKLTSLASPQPAAEAVLWTRLAMVFGTLESQWAERLGLVKHDEKSGWIDPNGFKSAPLLITFRSHVAVIECLGQKL